MKGNMGVDMYNILICDDEPNIVKALKIYLSEENYVLFTASDGREAIEIIRNNEIHLVLMDIMMPEMDGLTAMDGIRKFSNVPVILLTAKGEKTDKILGLTAGADDYITKPFDPMEVSARVKSQLRRYMQLGSGRVQEGVIRIGALELNYLHKSVTVDGERLSLTPKEYEILCLLMKNPGTVFAPADIYDKIWGGTSIGCESNVAVHIRHIREKIEIDPANPRYLKAIWGQGYMIERD